MSIGIRPRVATALRQMERPAPIGFTAEPYTVPSIVPRVECYSMTLRRYLQHLVGALPYLTHRTPAEEAEYQWITTFLRAPC